jgi:hypothetical protein
MSQNGVSASAQGIIDKGQPKNVKIMLIGNNGSKGNQFKANLVDP